MRNWHTARVHARGGAPCRICGLLATIALTLNGAPQTARPPSVMSAAPEGSILRGKLEYRVSSPTVPSGPAEGAIGDGYVFALSTDRRQILGRARTLNGPASAAGLWEISGLPTSGDIVMVGFSGSVHRLIWIDKVTLNGNKYTDLGTKYAGFSSFHPGGPSGASSVAALSSVWSLLSLLGWAAGEVDASNSAAQVDALTDRLLAEVGEVQPARSPAKDPLVVRSPTPRVSALPLRLRDSTATDAIDLIFCIDTTGSMGDDIDAVKTSAGRLIDQIFGVSSSVRMALVAYRDYGSESVTKGFPFTTDREEIRRSILSLTVGEGGDPPEAVYEALLHAIYTRDLGNWRNGVKKIIVLMGDAPPHTKKHTLDEVVKAAEEVDPAHVFPITVAGSGREALIAFGEIARRTGGVMGSTASAADLPREILKIVELGSKVADAPAFQGRVLQQMGDSIEIELETDAAVQPGMLALIFSRNAPELVIAEGPVLAGEGRHYQIDLRAAYGTEAIRPGCMVRIVNETALPPGNENGKRE